MVGFDREDERDYQELRLAEDRKYQELRLAEERKYQEERLEVDRVWRAVQDQRAHAWQEKYGRKYVVGWGVAIAAMLVGGQIIAAVMIIVWG